MRYSKRGEALKAPSSCSISKTAEPIASYLQQQERASRSSTPPTIQRRAVSSSSLQPSSDQHTAPNPVPKRILAGAVPKSLPKSQQMKCASSHRHLHRHLLRHCQRHPRRRRLSARRTTDRRTNTQGCASEKPQTRDPRCTQNWKQNPRSHQRSPTDRLSCTSLKNRSPSGVTISQSPVLNSGGI